MSDEQKHVEINQAKGLAKYFSVDICIKIFGVVIWEYHFPPKSNL